MLKKNTFYHKIFLYFVMSRKEIDKKMDHENSYNNWSKELLIDYKNTHHS